MFRAIAIQYQRLRHLHTGSMMRVITQQIEDQVIQHQLPVDFYTGIQKFSDFPQQHRHYAKLGSICRRVYVFGVADSVPPTIAGVEFIELPPVSALAQERFVLVDTPELWVTLVAKEVEDTTPSGTIRCFDGLLSYDEQVVDRMSLLMSQVMEVTYEPVLQRNHTLQNSHITEMNNRMLMILEQAKSTSQRRWMRAQALQKMAELSSKNPLNLLHTAAQQLQEMFHASGVAIALKTPNGQYTVPVAEGEAGGKGWRMSMSDGLVGRVIQQGRMIHFLEMSRCDGDILLPTAKAIICVPISNRQIYGALIMGTRNAQQWDEEDAQTLQAVGRLLAIHVEQALNVSPSSATLLLSPVKRLQTFIDEQQRAAESLLALQRKLRTHTGQGMTPKFMELLDQMELKNTDLIRATRNAKIVVNQSTTDSTPPTVTTV